MSTMANESLTLPLEVSNISTSAKSSLSNIVDDKSLKWVFVGGKGGVGKTTVSCSLAVSLAESGRKVLLVSTDPAHNVSDAFCHQFGKTPMPLREVPNLSVMEMDPKAILATLNEKLATRVSSNSELLNKLDSFLKCVPGVDETLTYAETINMAQTDEYELVVFDTAPTGHTIRLLPFPSMIEKLSESSLQIPDDLESMPDIFHSVCNDVYAMGDHFEEMFAMVKIANRLLRNPKLTTFVCICTADFLSVYETERLIQEISLAGMECRNIVVNKLIDEEQQDCKRCESKRKIQKDYLQHVYELYEDFHITEVPLVDDELRGVAQLRSFSNLLTKI